MVHVHDGCSSCLEEERRFRKKYEKSLDYALNKYGERIEQAQEEYELNTELAKDGEVVEDDEKYSGFNWFGLIVHLITMLIMLSIVVPLLNIIVHQINGDCFYGASNFTC